MREKGDRGSKKRERKEIEEEFRRDERKEIEEEKLSERK
jgi:hypothetical protein